MTGEHPQPRSISTSSPTKLPEGVRTSLSTSSSPLHHSEFHQQQQYYPNTPIRNQDSHQYYNQSHQHSRPQMRHPPHQRKANRDGGVYYNVQQHQTGRQSSHPHHYAQGRESTFFIFLETLSYHK